MSKRRIVIANWKMNPERLKEARALFTVVRKKAQALRRTTAVVCPSFLHLGALARKREAGNTFALGAQDVFFEDQGSHTGAISPSMLKDIGVRFVIVGHSERRAIGESDEQVAQKIIAALKVGLTPVVCIGEKERDQQGGFLRAIESQLHLSFLGVPRARVARVIVAYEPLWAIGKTATAAVTPEILQETALFIRKVFVSMFGKAAGFSIPVLYGGSVEDTNAAALMKDGGVVGFLVGHASLDGATFGHILTVVDSARI